MTYYSWRERSVDIIRRLLDKDALEELMSQWVPIKAGDPQYDPKYYYLIPLI